MWGHSVLITSRLVQCLLCGVAGLESVTEGNQNVCGGSALASRGLTCFEGFCVVCVRGSLSVVEMCSITIGC